MNRPLSPVSGAARTACAIALLLVLALPAAGCASDRPVSKELAARTFFARFCAGDFAALDHVNKIDRKRILAQLREFSRQREELLGRGEAQLRDDRYEPTHLSNWSLTLRADGFLQVGVQSAAVSADIILDKDGEYWRVVRLVMQPLRPATETPRKGGSNP